VLAVLDEVQSSHTPAAGLAAVGAVLPVVAKKIAAK
jgi:hypothetical protein